jgi:hypothetical protein
VKLRALRALDAVRRPDTAERLEVLRLLRMPVAGGVDGTAGGSEAGGVFVQHWHDAVAIRHFERTARAEVILDIDDDQRGVVQRIVHG